MSAAKTVEQRLEEWAKQPGAFITPDERVFIKDLRGAARNGVGYGWMQQVIEWEWGPGAWGPEYFTKAIKELERELAEARQQNIEMSLGRSAANTLRKMVEERAEALELESAELRAALRWIPVSERLPDAGVKVIAFYLNSLGHSRRVRAEYVPKFTLEEDGDFDGQTEYDEATDTAYWPAGWYETNEHEDTNWRIDETVTHWTPMPELSDAMLSKPAQEG